MLRFKKPVKRALPLFAAILMIAFATGCGAPKLSAKFDEEAVKQKAQNVIALSTHRIPRAYGNSPRRP